MIISHGKKDYSYDMLKPAVDKGMKVVTFDTVIDKDAKICLKSPPPSRMTSNSLNCSLNEIAALAKDGKPVRVIKLWWGPVFRPLTAARPSMVPWKKRHHQDTGNCRPSNFQDVQVTWPLKSGPACQIPESTVDAIWGPG
jgi:simple sugar transport system substrate-binding protein